MTNGNGATIEEAAQELGPRTPRPFSESAGIPWESMVNEGHLFPYRCPTWSGGGILGLPAGSPLAAQQQQVPGAVLVCGCGVVKVVPLTPQNRTG